MCKCSGPGCALDLQHAAGIEGFDIVAVNGASKSADAMMKARQSKMGRALNFWKGTIDCQNNHFCAFLF